MRAGDEVRVFSRSRHQPAPEGGWTGRVISVGRKYAIAEYETQDRDYAGGGTRTSLRTVEFDIETGDDRGDRTSTAKLVRTPEQLAEDRRKAAAITVLNARGIELRPGCRLSAQQAEQLAAVVSSWPS